MENNLEGLGGEGTAAFQQVLRRCSVATAGKPTMLTAETGVGASGHLGKKGCVQLRTVRSGRSPGRVVSNGRAC